MANVDRRTAAKMEMVLEEVFGGVLHGGDHESRKHVAARLIESAMEGNVTLDHLRAVGGAAFQQLSARKLA